MLELLWRRVVRSVSVLFFVPVRTAESICCFRVKNTTEFKPPSFLLFEMIF